MRLYLCLLSFLPSSSSFRLFGDRVNRLLLGSMIYVFSFQVFFLIEASDSYAEHLIYKSCRDKESVKYILQCNDKVI